jgi:hypothetical protein
MGALSVAVTAVVVAVLVVGSTGDVAAITVVVVDNEPASLVVMRASVAVAKPAPSVVVANSTVCVVDTTITFVVAINVAGVDRAAGVVVVVADV